MALHAAHVAVHHVIDSGEMKLEFATDLKGSFRSLDMLAQRQVRREAQPDDQGNRESPRSQAPFLAAPVEDRGRHHPLVAGAFHEQCTNALGTQDLVAADREKVAVQCPDLRNFLAERLCGVDMKSAFDAATSGAIPSTG